MSRKWKNWVIAASLCTASIATNVAHASAKEDLLRSIIVLKNMAISGAKASDFSAQMTSVATDFEIYEKTLNKTQHSLVKSLVEYGNYDVLTLRNGTSEKSSLMMCAINKTMESDSCQKLYYSASQKMGMVVAGEGAGRIPTTDNANAINLLLNDMALRSLQKYSEKASAGLKK